MTVFTETDRLIIRTLEAEDDEEMFRMDSNAEVHRFLGQKPVKTIDEIREVIAKIQQQYADYGIGRWAVADIDTNKFMGWTGFRFMPMTINKHSNYYDFGYRFMQEHWGKGYATESALAALRYGQEILKLKDIYAMTDVDNKASRHVLEKIGFRHAETFAYDELELRWKEPGEPTTWFELAPLKP